LLESPLPTAAPNLQPVASGNNRNYLWGISHVRLFQGLIAVILAVVILLVLGDDVTAADPGRSLAFTPSPAFLLRANKNLTSVSLFLLMFPSVKIRRHLSI
jgi:hypothetical protein